MQHATTEALRVMHFDSSSGLREAFINEDQTLTGTIPLYKVEQVLKRTGLAIPPETLPKVIAKYTSADQRFRWLAFVQKLEKRTRSFGQLPRSSSPLARAPSMLSKLHNSANRLELAGQGSIEALPPLHRVGASPTKRHDPPIGGHSPFRGSTLSRSPSLLLRGHVHPNGSPASPGGSLPMPRAYSSAYMPPGGSSPTRSQAHMRKSASAISLAASPEEYYARRSERIRSMASAAGLSYDATANLGPSKMTLSTRRPLERSAGEEMSAIGGGGTFLPEVGLRFTKSQAKLARTFEWQQRKAATKQAQAAADAAAEAALGIEYEDYTSSGPSAAEVAAAEEDKAERRKQLKKGSFVTAASTAMNSRFKDMFKAFQFVDMDRSGTLDYKELRRALDLWNLPIDDQKLQELIEACDHDGDGQVDYKEFVDVLARDTVNPEAMGKRDMDAKAAFGVDNIDKALCVAAARLGSKPLAAPYASLTVSPRPCLHTAYYLELLLAFLACLLPRFSLPASVPPLIPSLYPPSTLPIPSVYTLPSPLRSSALSLYSHSIPVTLPLTRTSRPLDAPTPLCFSAASATTRPISTRTRWRRAIAATRWPRKMATATSSTATAALSISKNTSELHTSQRASQRQCGATVRQSAVRRDKSVATGTSLHLMS